MSATQPQVSWDNRPALSRARRRQLLDVCHARGIGLASENIPKTQILQLMEANGINLAEPVKELDWYAVQGKDEQGQMHTEMYPVIPDHQSKSENINYEKLIAEKVAAQEKAEEVVSEQNDVINQLMSRLDALEKDRVPLHTMSFTQLKLVGKNRGMKVSQYKNKAEILQALEA